MPEGSGWEALGPASWQSDGETEIRFMVRGELATDGSIRLVRRKIPWRPGEKLDETGPDADEYSLEVPFFNTLVEPDIEGVQMWPNRLNLLWDQFKLAKTGTLHLPWKRNIRGKVDRYRRAASSEGEREGEVLTFHVVEDSEDNLDRAAATNVGVRANLSRIVEEARFDAESEGGWDGSFEDLTAFAADLEGVLNAPAEFMSDVQHKARRVGRAAASIRKSLSTRTDGRALISGPDGEPLNRRLLLIEELSAQAEADAQASLPQTIAVRFSTWRDIHSVAAEFGQNARDLMAINGHIEDLNAIPPLTPIYIFAG